MHYVDRSVQRSLLVAMVALEVVLVAAATWQLHWHLNELIEESLYRVHLADAGPTLVQLTTEAAGVLSMFIAVNVVALLLAEGIWSRHENLVLRKFTALIDKTRRLDFSRDTEPLRRHEVIAAVLAWREAERARLSAIRERVGKLDAAVSGDYDPQGMREALAGVTALMWRRPEEHAEGGKGPAQGITR